MWHILALHLGGTKAELKARMTAAEFEEWRVFYSIRPFGPWHDDYRIAAFNMSIRSMMCDRKLSIRDFMCVRPKERPQTQKEMNDVLEMCGLGLNQ